MKVNGTCSGSVSSCKWTAGNMTSQGFWILIISLVYTSNVQVVVLLHLPVCSVHMVAKEWARISTLPMVFKWVTFVTLSIELMSILASTWKNSSIISPITM